MEHRSNWCNGLKRINWCQEVDNHRVYEEIYFFLFVILCELYNHKLTQIENLSFNIIKENILWFLKTELVIFAY